MTEEHDISADDCVSADCFETPISALYPRIDPSYFAGMDGIWQGGGRSGVCPYVGFRNLNGESDPFDTEDRRAKPSVEAGLKIEF